ncbi:MAG: maleylpyruvate isomerase N-terminal domain-containing protein, partial [Actinomycetota bacterium]
MDVVDSLELTFDHARGVIAAVRPNQHDAKTPCEEWTVRDLLGHMIGVVAGLGARQVVNHRHRSNSHQTLPPSSTRRPRRRLRPGARRACSTASSTPAPARCPATSSPRSTCSTPPPTPGTW